jgi:hypothetical protein
LQTLRPHSTPSYGEPGLNIAIDARMIQSHSMHGIARYVYELLNSLRVQATHHQFFILVNKASPLIAGEVA